MTQVPWYQTSQPSQPTQNVVQFSVDSPQRHSCGCPADWFVMGACVAVAAAVAAPVAAPVAAVGWVLPLLFGWLNCGSCCWSEQLPVGSGRLRPATMVWCGQNDFARIVESV